MGAYSEMPSRGKEHSEPRTRNRDALPSIPRKSALTQFVDEKVSDARFDVDLTRLPIPDAEIEEPNGRKSSLFCLRDFIFEETLASPATTCRVQTPPLPAPIHPCKERRSLRLHVPEENIISTLSLWPSSDCGITRGFRKIALPRVVVSQ